MIDLHEIDDIYAEKLKRIPKTMPKHWKGRDGQPRVETSIDQCSPSCSICGGTGYYREELPMGAGGFGELKICPNVDRFKLPYARKFGILEEEAKSLTWADVRGAPGVVGVVEAARAAREVIERGHGWVFLWGNYGIGKTLILKVATAATLRSGDDAAYVRMAEIFDNLRASFDEGSEESEASRLEWWAGLPVLCIDEFDKVRATAYGKERSFVLMDRRYEQAVRQESITIIASNEPPGSFDGYLYDRIRDGRFYVREIQGESQRPGQRWNNARME